MKDVFAQMERDLADSQARQLGRAREEGETTGRAQADAEMKAELDAYQARIPEARNSARTEEVARCKAIIEAPEAAGRRDLALHLATKTDMPADAATALLAASPTAATVAPVSTRRSRTQERLHDTAADWNDVMRGVSAEAAPVTH